jgi:hypothetical protein
MTTKRIDLPAFHRLTVNVQLGAVRVWEEGDETNSGLAEVGFDATFGPYRNARAFRYATDNSNAVTVTTAYAPGPGEYLYQDLPAADENNGMMAVCLDGDGGDPCLVVAQNDIWNIVAFGSEAADNTAPTLSDQTAAATADTTATGSVSTDEGNGTLYWVVTESATSPTGTQIKAGTDDSDGAAADDGSFTVIRRGAQPAISVTGLTAETAYTMHFYHEDAASNGSTVVKSAEFTTEAAA